MHLLGFLKDSKIISENFQLEFLIICTCISQVETGKQNTNYIL